MQPLHVGFTSDKGGNTIKVTWFTRKQALHHVSLLEKKNRNFNFTVFVCNLSNKLIMFRFLLSGRYGILI